MKLIVGLGNPGKNYENTRHNVGFIFLDSYLDSKRIELNKKKFNGLYTDYVGEKGEELVDVERSPIFVSKAFWSSTDVNVLSIISFISHKFNQLLFILFFAINFF